MQNPWIKINFSEEYILPEDREKIITFNNKVKNKEHKIHLELIPEPYLGNINSNIVLLNLNPGYNKTDILFHGKNREFKIASINNLEHTYNNYEFYLLNPKFREYGGNKWWSKKLNPLIELFSLEKVSNSICVFEFFPYHSKKYKAMKDLLKSQQYTIHLLKQAMKRNALIIIMRSERIWINHVPELKSYKNKFKLNNPQNPVISKNNLPSGFTHLTKEINKKFFNQIVTNKCHINI